MKNAVTLLILVMNLTAAYAASPDPAGYPSALPSGTRLILHSRGRLVVPAGQTMYTVVTSTRAPYQSRCTFWTSESAPTDRVLDGEYVIESGYENGLWVRSEGLVFANPATGAKPLLHAMSCTLDNNQPPTNGQFIELLGGVNDAELVLPEASAPVSLPAED